LRRVYATVSLVTNLFALVSAPFAVQQWFGRLAVSLLVCGFEVLLFTLVVLSSWRRLLAEAFGILQRPTESYALLQRNEGTIHPDFSATILTTHELICRKVDPDDLCDSFEAKGGSRVLSPQNWSSPDSVLVRVAQSKTRHIMHHYWWPHQPITPFRPYVHTYRREDLGPWGDDGFYFVTRFVRPVGLYEVVFEAPLDIEWAIALDVSSLRTRFSDLWFWRVARRGYGQRGQNPFQPVVNGRTVTFHMMNPRPHTATMLFCLFTGGYSKLDANVRSKHRVASHLFGRHSSYLTR
jgi:hypothetical protein